MDLHKNEEFKIWFVKISTCHFSKGIYVIIELISDDAFAASCDVNVSPCMLIICPSNIQDDIPKAKF